MPQVRQLANAALARTLALLTEKKGLVQAIAERLMEKEVRRAPPTPPVVFTTNPPASSNFVSRRILHA